MGRHGGLMVTVASAHVPKINNNYFVFNNDKINDIQTFTAYLLLIIRFIFSVIIQYDVQLISYVQEFTYHRFFTIFVSQGLSKYNLQ